MHQRLLQLFLPEGPMVYCKGHSWTTMDKTVNWIISVMTDCYSKLTKAVLTKWTTVTDVVRLSFESWDMPDSFLERSLTENGPHFVRTSLPVYVSRWVHDWWRKLSITCRTTVILRDAIDNNKWTRQLRWWSQEQLRYICSAVEVRIQCTKARDDQNESSELVEKSATGRVWDITTMNFFV